ncbi:BQ2448_544 [Microbotryum intermedium]|uniref:BQ2448_544 protein n=1 Tax=Microbotryum intermedium TaxID=269621 RepID=A0A238F8S2_9BASI|nr:BQ2448_544 [Microbotryum intermedium]
MTHHKQSKGMAEMDRVRFFRGHKGKACATDGHLFPCSNKVLGVLLEGHMPDVGDHA